MHVGPSQDFGKIPHQGMSHGPTMDARLRWPAMTSCRTFGSVSHLPPCGGFGTRGHSSTRDAFLCRGFTRPRLRGRGASRSSVHPPSSKVFGGEVFTGPLPGEPVAGPFAPASICRSGQETGYRCDEASIRCGSSSLLACLQTC